MNNQSWGLRKMLLLCLILIIALIVALYIVDTKVVKIFGTNGYINSIFSNNDSTNYNTTELKMISAAKKYVSAAYSTGLEEGDPLYIKVSSLQRDKFLDQLIDPESQDIICSGYVKVLKTDGNDTYRAYLKCGNNYETEGYLARLDG